MGKIRKAYNLVRYGSYSDQVLDRMYSIRDPATNKVRSQVRIRTIDPNALRYSANEAIQFLARRGAGNEYRRGIGSSRGPINKTNSMLEIRIDPNYSRQDKPSLSNILQNP